MAYKIEVAANRYDLLCLEDVATHFRNYLGIDEAPKFRVKNHSEQLKKVFVKASDESVRLYALGITLRNARLDLKSYNSFIHLQDTLHQNL